MDLRLRLNGGDGPLYSLQCLPIAKLVVFALVLFATFACGPIVLPRVIPKFEVRETCDEGPIAGRKIQQLFDTTLWSDNTLAEGYYLTFADSDCQIRFNDYQLAAGFGPQLMDWFIGSGVSFPLIEIDGRKIPLFGSTEFMDAFASEFLQNCQSALVERTLCIERLISVADNAHLLRISIPFPEAKSPRELIVIDQKIFYNGQRL